MFDHYIRRKKVTVFAIKKGTKNIFEVPKASGMRIPMEKDA